VIGCVEANTYTRHTSGRTVGEHKARSWLRFKMYDRGGVGDGSVLRYRPRCASQWQMVFWGDEYVDEGTVPRDSPPARRRTLSDPPIGELFVLRLVKSTYC
jgi:hypothetical protein